MYRFATSTNYLILCGPHLGMPQFISILTLSAQGEHTHHRLRAQSQKIASPLQTPVTGEWILGKSVSFVEKNGKNAEASGQKGTPST